MLSSGIAFECSTVSLLGAMPLNLQTTTDTTSSLTANQLSPSLSDESNSKNHSEGLCLLSIIEYSWQSVSAVDLDGQIDQKLDVLDSLQISKPFASFQITFPCYIVTYVDILTAL